MELTYVIQRSAKRRTLTITIERDRRVVVHAPVHASDEVIQRTVDSRRQWIFGELRRGRKYRPLPHPPGKELVSGESAFYLGRSYRIEVRAAAAEGIRFTQQFQIPASLEGRRKVAMREWYLARAREVILPRVSQHAVALGVEYRRARIVDTRYRWGSCTIGRIVSLNWRLIKAPMFVIDYVIVHELAHLRETNHTSVFWCIVRAQMPKMEKARAWLAENGQMLEAEM